MLFYKTLEPTFKVVFQFLWSNIMKKNGKNTFEKNYEMCESSVFQSIMLYNEI